MLRGLVHSRQLQALALQSSCPPRLPAFLMPPVFISLYRSFVSGSVLRCSLQLETSSESIVGITWAEKKEAWKHSPLALSFRPICRLLLNMQSDEGNLLLLLLLVPINEKMWGKPRMMHDCKTKFWLLSGNRHLKPRRRGTYTQVLLFLCIF